MSDLVRILAAVSFAASRHRNQRRKGAQPGPLTDPAAKAVIFCVALALPSVAGAWGHGEYGKEGNRGQYTEPRCRDRDDGNHYGRYRPFYSYPARDCADEPRRYSRRTGRMEPSCAVPCVPDCAVDKD